MLWLQNIALESSKNVILTLPIFSKKKSVKCYRRAVRVLMHLNLFT